MVKGDLLATEMCTSFNLRKASRAVTQFYDDALRDSGLRSTQFSLLAAASVSGSISIKRLADEMAMDRTTLTRNLKPLTEEGLLRVETGADRRVRNVTVTPQGEALMERAAPMWRGAQTRMIDKLGDERWGDLLRHLQGVRRVLRE